METKPPPAPDQILRFFRHSHLPPHLARVSRQFSEIAAKVVLLCPPCAERTASLRLILQAKDGAVRCLVPDDDKFLAEWAAEMAAAQFDLDQQIIPNGANS